MVFSRRDSGKGLSRRDGRLKLKDLSLDGEGLRLVSAALDGRDYAIPDDVQKLVVPALRHRIVLGPTAEMVSPSMSTGIRQSAAALIRRFRSAMTAEQPTNGGSSDAATPGSTG